MSRTNSISAIDALSTFLDTLRDLGYAPEEVKKALVYFAGPSTSVDWEAVGRILETHHTLGDTYITGTSNWGAAIWKAAHGIGANASSGEGA